MPRLPLRPRGLAFRAALLTALAAGVAAADGRIGVPAAREGARATAGAPQAEVLETSDPEDTAASALAAGRPDVPSGTGTADAQGGAVGPDTASGSRAERPARLPAAPDSARPAGATRRAVIGSAPGASRPASPGPYSPAARNREMEYGSPRHTNFKSDFLLPGLSTLLPGFGQYLQEDWSGFAYTGAGATGLILFLRAAVEADRDEGGPDTAISLSTESPTSRKALLGLMAYQGSGFLSAYSAFRISVPRMQAEDGKYGFLGEGEGESVGDLMVSPFRFGHLARPTALIPLGLLAGAVGWVVADERSHRRDWTLSGDDFLFTGALAWNAGVTEEAVFRGWIYPWCYQNLWNNFWLANTLQATLFGLAHFNPQSNPVPWPQTVIGFYLGWLTHRNRWTLSESIFVHAWWDMILFAGMVATQYRDADARASMRIELPIGW